MTTNNNTQCCTQKHNVQSVVQAGTPQLSAVQRIILLCVAVCFLLGAVPLSVRSQARKSEVPPSLLAGANSRGGDNRGRNITPFGQLKKEFNKGFDLDSLRRFKQYLREREKEENTRRARVKQPPVFSGLDMEFGVPMPLKGNDKLDMKKHGEWETLANGDRVWRLVVSAPNAVNMSFVFEEFDLPVGSKLYVYSTENAERGDPAQYYTSEHCDIRKGKTKQFAIAPLSGSTIIFEYYQPKASVAIDDQKTPNIVLETITFGYERIATLNEIPRPIGKSMTTSNYYTGTCGLLPCGYGATAHFPCLINSNPYQYSQNVIQSASKSAVQIIQPGTGKAFSATLINSDQQYEWDRGRYRPVNYVVTHSHGSSMAGIANAIFRYNYEEPLYLNLVEDYFGSTFILQGNPNAGGDFAVTQAYGAPTDAWYSGWTTILPKIQTGISPTHGDIFGISFPFMDAKKVRMGQYTRSIPSDAETMFVVSGATLNYSSGGGNYRFDNGKYIGANRANNYPNTGPVICPTATNFDVFTSFYTMWNWYEGGLRSILAPLSGESMFHGELDGAFYPVCNTFPFDCWTAKNNSTILPTLRNSIEGNGIKQSHLEDKQLSEENLSLGISPNPASQLATITIYSYEIERYIVQLHNTTSLQSTTRIYEGTASPRKEFTINTHDFSNGSYVISVIGVKKSGKIIKSFSQLLITR
jgi:hypothetical protein